jgi:hypothetical protein
VSRVLLLLRNTPPLPCCSLGRLGSRLSVVAFIAEEPLVATLIAAAIPQWLLMVNHCAGCRSACGPACLAYTVIAALDALAVFNTCASTLTYSYGLEWRHDLQSAWHYLEAWFKVG